MTIIVNGNSPHSAMHLEGVIDQSTSPTDRNTTFVSASMYMNGSVLQYPLGAVYDDLWIHFDSSMDLAQNSNKLVGGFNSSAGRYDWYIQRIDAGGMRFEYWNGSSFVPVGMTYPDEEPENYHVYDVHYTVHPTEGVLEVFMDEERIFWAENLDTSGFAVDTVRICARQNSPIYLSQVIIADEPTLAWRAFNQSITNSFEPIRFVGSKLAGQPGVVSGNTTLDITSGLVGGIDTAVRAGDFVVAVQAVGSTVDRALTISDGTTNYTLIGSELFSNDSFDTNLRLAWKRMGSTPDTTVTFGPTGSLNDAGVIGVFVFRGVHSTTPFDVTPLSALNGNTGNVDPPTLTPVTPGAFLWSVGAAAHGGNITGFTTTDLRNINELNQTGVNQIRLMGGTYFEWVSGSFNPAVYAAVGSLNTNSSAAFHVALRPEQAPNNFSYMPANAMVSASLANGNLGWLIASNTPDQTFVCKGARQALPSQGYNIKALSMNAKVKSGLTGPQAVQPHFRLNTENHFDTQISLNQDFQSVYKAWEINPLTGLPWTIDDANNALIGIRSRT